MIVVTCFIPLDVYVLTNVVVGFVVVTVGSFVLELDLLLLLLLLLEDDLLEEVVVVLLVVVTGLEMDELDFSELVVVFGVLEVFEVVTGLEVVELDFPDEVVVFNVLEDLELVVLTFVLETVLLAVILELVECMEELDLMLVEVAALVLLAAADDDVEAQAPTIDGTAFAPEPMTTTLVPQLAAGAI